MIFKPALIHLFAVSRSPRLALAHELQQSNTITKCWNPSYFATSKWPSCAANIKAVPPSQRPWFTSASASLDAPHMIPLRRLIDSNWNSPLRKHKEATALTENKRFWGQRSAKAHRWFVSASKQLEASRPHRHVLPPVGACCMSVFVQESSQWISAIQQDTASVPSGLCKLMLCTSVASLWISCATSAVATFKWTPEQSQVHEWPLTLTSYVEQTNKQASKQTNKQTTGKQAKQSNPNQAKPIETTTNINKYSLTC